MKETEKGALAYLYLSHYQLQEGKLAEAIQTLETCQQGEANCLEIDLLLVKFYDLSNQPEKAMKLAIQSSQILSEQNPEQAITVYKKLLTQNPEQLDLYFCLARLLESSQERAHLLLKGACHALKARNYETASRLCQEANTCFQDSFFDQLVNLDLLSKQEKFPAIKQKLLSLAKAFEEKELTKQMLQTYKMLFQIEKEPEYCEKILAAYKKLKKPHKQAEWYITCLSLLIDAKKWSQAEKIAHEALKKANEFQKVFLYKSLEKVYTNWHGYELQNLWPKLGKTYRESKQLAEAEKTYRKAYERFHRFEEVLALAETLKDSGKIKESVQTYCEAAAKALLEQNTERLLLCTREIKQIDPHLQHLDLNQRMHLLNQEHILRLSEELYTSRQKIASLEIQEEKRRIAEEQEKTRAVEAQKTAEPKSSAPPRIAFGKIEWEKYFGDVGAQPSLPTNIGEILSGPCPFYEGKRVEDTHMLLLIPKTVNGAPLTLNSLEELIKRPRGGGHATKYLNYDDRVRKKLGDTSASRSYWVLMTKDVLPDSRNKPHCDQCLLVSIRHKPYELPRALEATASILMHHVRTGDRLYTDSPWTLTRCQESPSSIRNVVIGRFSSDGLDVDSDACLVAFTDLGVAGVRRF